MDLHRHIQQLSKPTAAIFLLSPKFPENFIWVHLLVSSYVLPNVPSSFCSHCNAVQVAHDFCSKVSLHMPASHFNSLGCHWLMSCCGAMPLCLLWLSLLALPLLCYFGEFSRSVLQFCGSSYMQNHSLFCLSFIPEYFQVQTNSASSSTETICSSASLTLNWAPFIWSKICVFSSSVFSWMTDHWLSST